MTGQTGNDAGGGKAVDGTLFGGTNSGACSAITVDGSTFNAVSYSSGVVTGKIASVVVRYNLTPICSDTDVPFTIDGSGAIEFSTSIGTCEVDGIVDADTVVGVAFP